MAVSDSPVFISRISNSTLTTSNLYNFVFASSAGYVTVGDPASTGGNRPIGVYYGGGGRTTSTDKEAVQVAISGVLKVKMAASTLAAGELVACSSDGLGCTPTTNHYVVGRILNYSSGSANRIASVLFWPVPVRYSAALISTT